jgi:hypothetical protein
MVKNPVKPRGKKKEVKIKENDFTTSKKFLSTLDKFIKAKPIKKEETK